MCFHIIKYVFSNHRICIFTLLNMYIHFTTHAHFLPPFCECFHICGHDKSTPTAAKGLPKHCKRIAKTLLTDCQNIADGLPKHCERFAKMLLTDCQNIADGLPKHCERFAKMLLTDCHFAANGL